MGRAKEDPLFCGRHLRARLGVTFRLREKGIILFIKGKGIILFIIEKVTPKLKI